MSLGKVVRVFASIVLSTCTVYASPVAASQTCTYEGDKLVCREDKETSKPACNPWSPFECSTEIPPGS